MLAPKLEDKVPHKNQHTMDEIICAWKAEEKQS